MFDDNDLFNDNKASNNLDFLRQARNKKASQPKQQTKNLWDNNNNDDNDFDHFDNSKPKEEAPQQLFDLLGDNNDNDNNNNGFSRSQQTKSRLAGRTQQRIKNQTPQNSNSAAQQDFLYSNNDNKLEDDEEEKPTQQTSNPFDVYNNVGTSNTTTDSSRPGTSTSMNARARLAQQQKARLSQAKNNATTEGTLVTNQMLRGNKYNNIYEGSTYEFGRTQGSDFFYDPTQKSMDKAGLPELQKTNHVISYKADEVPASTQFQQINLQADEAEPVKKEAPKKTVQRQDSESQSPVQKSPMTKQNSDIYSPMEEDKNDDDKGGQSSDDEPTKEELKALEKQKKELNKQQDAEIGIVHMPPAAGNEVSKVWNIDVRDITDMKAFLMSPCPKGYRIECTIKRDRSGISNKFYPKYHCYLSNGPQYLMSGKKRAHNKTSNYLVSYNKNEIKKNSAYCLGKVRSNFLGTEFNIFDHGLNPNKSRDIERLRANLGVVLYESNLLSAKGPRKMRVLLPDVDERSNEVYQFRPLSTREGIMNNFKTGKKNGVKEFFNKTPKWNEQLQAFVLNFNGRVEKPSVKNFQMIDERSDDRIYLQFGRVTGDTFNMDFEWPLSPFQAFTICLSSFDYKIACE